MLDSIVSHFQSAFILNRKIQDNIIISHEILHSFKKKRAKNGYMAIKLDLSKTFDRLEWPFIIVVFKKLGFSDDWCQLILQCINTISYSVLINGLPGEVFFPSRGIRQGDCLPPYIFILCMEVLSQLLLKGRIKLSCSDFGLVSDAVCAEVTALFLAISWVKELKLSKVLFVSDFLQVVDFVNEVISSVGWRCSDLLEDCRRFISSSNVYNVVYVNRIKNRIAD